MCIVPSQSQQHASEFFSIIFSSRNRVNRVKTNPLQCVKKLKQLTAAITNYLAVHQDL